MTICLTRSFHFWKTNSKEIMLKAEKTSVGGKCMWEDKMDV